jgi:hypothetical protein
LYLFCLRRSMRSSIMVIRSSSSSSGYIWRAYSRNSGHSVGAISATLGICPTMERTFSRGTPLYSANLRQDLVLGMSAPESQRLTVAWLMPKSEASWLGRRLRRRINSLRKEIRGTSSVLTLTFYKLRPVIVKDGQGLLLVIYHLVMTRRLGCLSRLSLPQQFVNVPLGEMKAQAL